MAEKYDLLKTQKNEVFKILQNASLETANFSWAEYETISYITGGSYKKTVPRLNYLDGDYYFQFDMSSSEHLCDFSPSIDKRVEHRDAGHSWNNVKMNVQRWTEYLKREIEAPDLWTEMEKYKVAFSLALPEQLLNEPIPTYEAEKISEKLNLLADKIEEQFELTNEQNQFVRSKLDYLADATKRQRSVDWAHTLIGVSVTIAVGLSLAPDKAKELWELLKTIGEFIHLIGG